MAAKKMFPPGEIERLLGRHVVSPFGDDYDEVKLGIAFRILAGQIVMQFSDHVEWIVHDQRRRSKTGGDADREGR